MAQDSNICRRGLGIHKIRHRKGCAEMLPSIPPRQHGNIRTFLERAIRSTGLKASSGNNHCILSPGEISREHV